MGRIRNWLWSKAGLGSENWVWEAKEKTGCCGKLLELDALTSAEKFSFPDCPRVPSQPSWVRNTWCPGSGKMSVSQGTKIPVYSFTKTGNMWKGRVGGEEYMLCLGELVVFPSMWRTQELNSLLERYDSHSLCLSSVHMYVYIFTYVCNIQSNIEIFLVLKIECRERNCLYCHVIS